MGKRGELTEEIKQRGVELMGKEITQRELRLIPYVQYCLLNVGKLDPTKVNKEERDILSDWQKRGFISGGASGISCSERFWEVMHELLWMAYVDYDEAA
ncbi:hypothetical protein [Enterobacter asburiae]|uniref:hypothetical protein n=1 Tax=Enterobacter asburiae TaxID=61645 RepID=UPI0021D00CE1|nr:hypothetical protein [Enterobacter asburiae]MCU6241168.1 hypothetical protein [Enterobacter asburiae]